MEDLEALAQTVLSMMHICTAIAKMTLDIAATLTPLILVSFILILRYLYHLYFHLWNLLTVTYRYLCPKLQWRFSM